MTARIVRAEIATEARDTLKACLAEMEQLDESCDHSVGICWCGYHGAMERAQRAIDKINASLGE